MMGDRKPAYYAILPAKIRYDTELRPNAKLLYAEITALADANGYSWATNDYFAQLFDLSPKTVSDLIKTLARRGYLTVEVLRDGKNEVVERRLWIDKPPVISEDTPPPKNGGTPPPEIEGTPPPKNGEKNNIDIRNTNPLTPKGGKGAPKPKGAPTWKPERFASFWSAWPRGEAKQDAIRAWDKLRPDDDLIELMGQAFLRKKGTEQWQRGIGIPYASTWLNQRRWEDEDKMPGRTLNAPDTSGWADDPEVM